MISIVPVALCFLLALFTLSLGVRIKAQRVLSTIGAFAVLGVCADIAWQVLNFGAFSLAFGNWAAPYGIVFHIDMASAALMLVAALIYFCGVLASIATLSPQLELRGYYPLFHFLMLGILGAFSTGDLFNLYVWFEVLLIASFFLVTILKNKRALAGGFKYALLSVLSSFIFLAGVALIYNSTGTLNMLQLAEVQNTSGSFLIGVGLLSFAFLIKAGIFPFFFWLPASYPATVTPMAAVFSGLLTKVGVYGLLRLFVPFMPSLDESFIITIQILALFSMVIGVLGALSQDNMKGILSFHIISQVGYITLALTLGTSFGMAACVFYLLHHMVVKTNLFFAVAYIEAREKTTSLTHIGGLLQSEPLLSVLFAIPALSLAGIPPLSGFWAKVFVIQALIENRSLISIVLCLVVSLLTMMSMLKIWLGAFLKPLPSSLIKPRPRCRHWLFVSLVLLNVWTVTFGLIAEKGFELSKRITTELRIERSQP